MNEQLNARTSKENDLVNSGLIWVRMEEDGYVNKIHLDYKAS